MDEADDDEDNADDEDENEEGLRLKRKNLSLCPSCYRLLTRKSWRMVLRVAARSFSTPTQHWMLMHVRFFFVSKVMVVLFVAVR